jgi:nitrogen fixation NifU-like protein
MTEALRGKSVDEVEALFRSFHAMVTESDSHPELGKLEVLAGVREFPARVKCATLAWHTLHAALAGDKEPVSTE